MADQNGNIEMNDKHMKDVKINDIKSFEANPFRDDDTPLSLIIDVVDEY